MAKFDTLNMYSANKFSLLVGVLVWKFVETRVWAVQDYLLVGAYLTFVNSADSVDLCGRFDQRDIFAFNFSFFILDLFSNSDV